MEKNYLLEEIKNYWNLRAKGFGLAIDEELAYSSGRFWYNFFDEYFKEKSKILDCGCGAGFFSILLGELKKDVVAIDYSEAMLKEAKERTDTRNLKIEYRQADAQNLPFSEPLFDGIVCRDMLWNIQNPELVIKKWSEILKEGGKILICDGNYFLRLFDEEYSQLLKEKEEEIIKSKRNKLSEDNHAKYNENNVDFKIMDEIAKQLPLSPLKRPLWDVEELRKNGFKNIEVFDESATKINIFDEKDEKKEEIIEKTIMYRFFITATK